MKHIIFGVVVFSLSVSSYSLTVTEVANKIKQARQLVQDMSQTASRISSVSPKARISLMDGATGVVTNRNISSPLPSELGSIEEQIPVEIIFNSKVVPIAMAEYYARQKVLADMRAKDLTQNLATGESTTVIGFVWLTLFSLLLI